MNHRTPRLLGALALAVSLSAGTLAGTAVAATPAWTLSNVVASPSQVTAGDTVQIITTFVNDGSSNISQLYLNMAKPDGWTLQSVSAPSPVACTPVTTDPLMCSYGAVNAHTTVIVSAIYQTSTTAGTQRITALWNTTGVSNTDPKKSHGDSISRFADVSLVAATSTSNFAGRYVVTPSQQTVANGLALGSSNKQSTQVTVTITGLPVTVLDGFKGCDNGLEATCPTGIFGETSEINVNNGADTPIQVTIVEYKTVNASKVHGVYHSWLGSDNVIHSENITAVCGTQPAGEPCYTATDLSSQLLQLYVQINHNGKINGW
jgi:hypothetical protein